MTSAALNAVHDTQWSAQMIRKLDEGKSGGHTIIKRKPPCAQKLMLVVGVMNNVMNQIDNLHGGVH
jgi:hypothetical protein